MPQPGSTTETEVKIVKCSEDESVTGRNRESTVFFRFTLPLISFCNFLGGKKFIYFFLFLSLGSGGLVT